jgi:hypothetical protein
MKTTGSYANLTALLNLYLSLLLQSNPGSFVSYRLRMQVIFRSLKFVLQRKSSFSELEWGLDCP